MKTQRTIRTMRRHGMPTNAGFAGFLPTGKRVVRMARESRAERKALSLLGEAGINPNALFFAGLSGRRLARQVEAFFEASPGRREAYLSY